MSAIGSRLFAKETIKTWIIDFLGSLLLGGATLLGIVGMAGIKPGHRSMTFHLPVTCTHQREEPFMTESDTRQNADFDRRAWHAAKAEELASALDTDLEAGLGGDEIEKRQERFGANRLTPQSERTMLMRFISQFNNLFIYLLLAAGAVAAALGERLDSGVIFGVVLIIAVIGFIQEGRAERALEAVRGMLSSKARVIRGGKRGEIPAEDLVPGDLVLLEAGDGVPADVRVIHAKNLQAQEAALTGESTAVEKHPDPVAEDAELGDRASMVFSGTVITAGRGKGVVVAIGDDSEIGRISGMLSEVQTLKTPLMRRLDAFTKVLSAAILGLAALTFLVGVFVWGRGWGEMLLAAVTIAVAAIPEGLPAVMTVTLAIGVQRMARRNAIIRRLPAVETLGSVTIVCSDKTGTLTKNEMTAKTLRTADEDIEAGGVGYAPEGGFQHDERDIELEEHATAMEMVRAGMLCNDAKLKRRGDEWKPEGDPTEAALIVLAHKAGLDPEREDEEWPRVDVIPFASEHRYMATLNRSPEDKHVLYVKGAPERVLEMCASERRGGEVVGLGTERWHQRVDEIAGRGQRVLAVARKDVSGEPNELDEDEAERDLTLLGLFGLIDPPRKEAIDAVAACQAAGIRVKMITGDHALTAQAIARELGLENPDEALTGRDLEGIGEDEMRRHATKVDVFARASPEHKLRLVEALQAQGAITAMTGDGVNDAPALKRADMGIAMGRKGTDAAREASAMVLADDNFASIERAIEEGRTVYDNLKKAILFLLPVSAAEASVIVIAILAGMALPITPLQVLWVNMVSAVTLGLAFAWERAEGDIMRRSPRPTDEPLLTGFMVWRIGFVGTLLLLGAGLLFLQEQARDDTTLEFARTLAVNALVIGEIFYLLSARFFHAPSYTFSALSGNRVLLLFIGVAVVLQLLFTYAPFMNPLFGTEPLDAEAWGRCLAVGLAVFVLVEIEKWVVRKRLSGRTADKRGEGKRTHGEQGKTDPDNGARRESRDITRKEGDDMNESDEETRAEGEETKSEDNPRAEAETAHRNDDRKLAEADRKIAEADRKIAEAEKRIAEAEKRIAEAEKKIAEADLKSSGFS
jgi:P-type Ca2+ transporter type 2C